jgi:hypothetical protein
MAKFNLHLVGCPAPCVIKSESHTLNGVGEMLVRHRFLSALLVEEHGHVLDQPTQILVPLQRIHLIADAG